MSADPTHAAVTADGRTVLLPNIVGDEYGADIGEDATDAELRAFVAVSAPDRDWTAWRVGDAARFLQQRHGDDWPEYMPDTGHALKTWQNYATTARAWRNRSRRREWTERGLSHGHLAAVASIASEDLAAAEDWLEQATADGLSVTALRRRMKGEPDPDVGIGASLTDYVASAIGRKLEAMGLDLLSPAQHVELAGAALEAMRQHERAQLLPFEPEPEDESDESMPWEAAHAMSGSEEVAS